VTNLLEPFKNTERTRESLGGAQRGTRELGRVVRGGRGGAIFRLLETFAGMDSLQLRILRSALLTLRFGCSKVAVAEGEQAEDGFWLKGD
jgi:hypothetical protein